MSRVIALYRMRSIGARDGRVSETHSWRSFMTNKSTAWMAAAAVTTTFLQVLFFAAILPRPAAATDLAPPLAMSATAGRADPLVARGQYLAATSGCHDCHTEGYAEAAGGVPATRWLTGTSVGFKGPWGVSYPSNLRLTVQKMNEAQWLAFARVPRLPPMPWFALRDMTDEDLRALYRFMRSIGPAGVPAPVPAAPGVEVKTPYVTMVPQNLPATARR
jgi:mono/diheme cytochrome c family protein